jgi:hypothetical protein
MTAFQGGPHPPSFGECGAVDLVFAFRSNLPKCRVPHLRVVPFDAKVGSNMPLRRALALALALSNQIRGTRAFTSIALTRATGRPTTLK